MKKIFILFAFCFSFAQNTYAQCPVDFLQNGSMEICQFSTQVLNVTPGADNYEWIVNGSPVMNGTADSYTVPTITASTFTYQVTATFGTCTSSTTPVTVTVVPQPAPPIAVSADYCQFSILGPLQVTGVNLLWYTLQVGGPGIPNTPTPNTSIPGVTTYWVSQTINGCESDRAQLDILVMQNPVIGSIFYEDPAYPAPGSITLTGLIPNAVYTVNYTKDNIPQPAVTIATDVTGTLILTGLLAGTYDDITVIYNGCTSNSMGPYVLVEQNTFPGDVWPGDVNNDHYANNNDVLDLGLAYGATGTTRVGATNNWVNQPCSDWGTAQTNGEDMKYADCNGDGIVDNNDQDAITLNYGQYHPKGLHLPQLKSTAFPDLYFDLTGISFTAGTTVTVPIKLGTNALPMNDILGIAAKIKVQNITLDNAPTISNTTSWIGTGSSVMNFSKGVSTNQADWALVRTDHNNVDGDGTIAKVTMDIPTGATGDAILYFEDVKIINSAGQEILNYNVVDDTAAIVPVTISNTLKTEAAISVVPNPSEGPAELQVVLPATASVNINITDVMGRRVWNRNMVAAKGSNMIVLPATLSSGIYTIRIEGVNVRPAKWIRK